MFSAISVATVTLPIVAILVFILSEFGTGSVVWILALDVLIITLLVLMLTIYDIVKSGYIVSKTPSKIHPDTSIQSIFKVNETNLDMQTFNIFDIFKYDEETPKDNVIDGEETERTMYGTLKANEPESESPFKPRTAFVE